MPRAALAAGILIGFLLLLCGAARADDGGIEAGVHDAGGDAAGLVPEAPLDARVAQIQALETGTLDVAIEPRSLFEVPLDDEESVGIETLRIRALLRSVDEAAARPVHTKAPADAGTLRAAIAALEATDPAAWRDRIALDRARLSFYELDHAHRDAVLDTHAKRQDAARPKETDDERRSREAEAERQRALEAARAAHSESERLVAAELARLIELDTQVDAIRDRYHSENDAVLARKDIVLGWQHRAHAAKAAPAGDADATYDALRLALRRSRDELATAIDHLEDDDSAVPALDADPLGDLPLDTATTAVHDRRLAVSHTIALARQEERALREARAAALIDEVATLNRERLGLLASLSPDKRDAITGFTAEGWSQARSEVRHLSLILRYHFHVARSWLASPRDTARLAPWRAAATAIGWSLLVIVFVLGRRRTPKILALVEARFAEGDRAERHETPGVQTRAARFAGKVHLPLEWGCLFLGSWWLLPADAKNLLELELIATIIGWVLGGAIVVKAIDALAAEAPASLRSESSVAGDLRLRSLQLVGRTVVVFALILLLGARLVGRGTIYSWVLSTCWLAAVPVFLVLVRWWRGVVFDRLDRTRRKSGFQAWVLANRSGWKSFIAAMLGAVQLFALGVARTVRAWVLGFDVARRAHAYVFRRELDRLRDGAPAGELGPLPDAMRDALRPDRPYEHWLAGPADAVLAGIVKHIAEGRGSVFALVGARGMGKSTLLRELQHRTKDAVVVACSHATTDEDVRAALAARGALPAPPLVLLDDAHAIVAPVIGGLERFDAMITLARADAAHAIWVFAIDASVWPFLRRARDATPLFDETHVLLPWNETQIGALLADRGQGAKLVARFDDLLDKLPAGADDIDRQEALRAKQLGYERMLWDHVRGNPGLALEAWRASLAEDITGHVRVRPLQVPDASVLETLPDSLLFILRAILQLGPAALDDVARATRLTTSQVLDAVRFGEMHGVLAKEDERVSVTWQWLRAVTLLLERRHLLVNK